MIISEIDFNDFTDDINDIINIINKTLFSEYLNLSRTTLPFTIEIYKHKYINGIVIYIKFRNINRILHNVMPLRRDNIAQTLFSYITAYTISIIVSSAYTIAIILQITRIMRCFKKQKEQV